MPSSSNASADGFTLHSNLVMFKLSGTPSFTLNPCTFTFQSGYVQIKRGQWIERHHYDFTFQSGYVQMIVSDL